MLGNVPQPNRSLDRTSEYKQPFCHEGNCSNGVPVVGGAAEADGNPTVDSAVRQDFGRIRLPWNTTVGISRSRQARTARELCRCPRPKGPRDFSMTSEGGIHGEFLTAAVSKPWEVSLIARGQKAVGNRCRCVLRARAAGIRRRRRRLRR